MRRVVGRGAAVRFALLCGFFSAAFGAHRPARAEIEFDAGTLAGTVRTTGGSPLVGAYVTLDTKAGPVQAAIDGSGAYSLTNVPVGTYQVTAWFLAQPFERRAVTITKDTAAEASFSLAAGTLTGSVTVNGAPAREVEINLTEDGPSGCGVATSCSIPDDGKFCSCAVGSREFYCSGSVCHWNDERTAFVRTLADGTFSALLPVAAFHGDIYHTGWGIGWKQDGRIRVAPLPSTTIVENATAVAPLTAYRAGTLGGIVGTADLVRATGKNGLVGQIRGWAGGDGGYLLSLPFGDYDLEDERMDTHEVVRSSITIDSENPFTWSPGGTPAPSMRIVGSILADGVGAPFATVRFEALPPATTCAASTGCSWFDKETCGGCPTGDGRTYGCSPTGCYWDRSFAFLASTDMTGQFAVDLPYAGQYSVQPYAYSSEPKVVWGNIPLPSRTIDVVSGVGQTLIPFSYATGKVSGAFTTCGSAPLPNVWGSLSYSGGGGFQLYMFNPDATFATRLPAGLYRATMNWNGAPFAEKDLVVSSEMDATIHGNFDLGQLRGRILRNGQPAANVQIHLNELGPTSCGAFGETCVTDDATSCVCYAPSGRGYTCDKTSASCSWFAPHSVTTTTGSDAYFTATVPGGRYSLVAYATTVDPKDPKGGGGLIEVARTETAVTNCQLTEMGSSAATLPPGSDVVADLGDNVTLTFSSNASETLVTYSASSIAPAAPPPDGTSQVQFGGLFYDFAVSTPVASGTNVKVCLPYDVDDLAGVDPATLVVYHYEKQSDGSYKWVQLANVTRDPVAQVVCGETTSFSWFVVAKKLATTTPPVAAITGPTELVADGSCTGNGVWDASKSADPAGATLTYSWFVDGVAAGSEKTLSAAIHREGAHAVKLVVKTPAGLTGESSTVVNVIDRTAPTVSVTMSPSIIWPPNGDMREVTATPVVRDNCDAAPRTTVTSLVASNGSPADVSMALGKLYVRAFRDGKDSSGRTYVATFVTRDAAGNSVVSTGTVLVPHDLGK